jgi:Transposase IS116/IS110/IS902 family
MAADSEFTDVTDRLQCLRGISTLTAFGLAVEIGDWRRFTGRTIGAYVGLVPTEYSSGDTRSQGGLTKTGNGHVRRLLIESAGHHRKPYRPSQRLRRRWEMATPCVASSQSCRQSSPAYPMGTLRPTSQTSGDRQRCHRPRTRRLVLVVGRPRRLTHPQPSRWQR